MSETRSETSSKRRRYSEEFKQDAVRLVVVEKYSFEAAATAVGVYAQTLRHWHARLAPKPADPQSDNCCITAIGVVSTPATPTNGRCGRWASNAR